MQELTSKRPPKRFRKAGSGVDNATIMAMMTFMRATNVPFTVLIACLAVPVFANLALASEDETITLEMIEQAQNDWGDGLVMISKTHREGGDAKAAAVEMLETLYDFPDGKVLFKPTLASGDQTFRSDFEGALAYFVGGNPEYPSDSGFALLPFDSHRSDIDSYIVEDDVAIAMGHIWLKAPDGTETMVDKTFAYKLGDDGKLRIITHHSSLPFTPEP